MVCCSGGVVKPGCLLNVVGGDMKSRYRKVVIVLAQKNYLYFIGNRNPLGCNIVKTFIQGQFHACHHPSDWRFAWRYHSCSRVGQLRSVDKCRLAGRMGVFRLKSGIQNYWKCWLEVFLTG